MSRILLTRGRIIILAVTIFGFGAFLTLFVMFYRNPLDTLDSGREPVTDQFVGQTKEAITGRFGSPSHEWEGCYGNPPVSYTEAHKPSITMTYKRCTGVLYLSFEQVGDNWVCYSSHWMPNGWAF
jgi:hypothetical protein